MSTGEHDALRAKLTEAVPRLQRDFLLYGPLQGTFPADIRSDLVRVFTQVLARALTDGSARELVSFVEAVVWEARKAGVQPSAFNGWFARYESTVHGLLSPDEWRKIAPYLQVVQESARRLQN